MYMYVVVHIAKRFCLDRLSSEVSIVGTASDGPLQQQLLRSPVCSTSTSSFKSAEREQRGKRPEESYFQPPSSSSSTRG